MKKINSLAVIVIVLLLSCKKEPGEGGFASIEGKVFLKNYDAYFSILSSQYYQPGETVYIIYGDQTEVGNTVKTSYDGSFKFNYLRKGKYKVYVIGEDSSITNRSNPKIEMVEVTISGKKDKKNIGDLVILK
jgi:hypothetical protein